MRGFSIAFLYNDTFLYDFTLYEFIEIVHLVGYEISLEKP